MSIQKRMTLIVSLVGAFFLLGGVYTIATTTTYDRPAEMIAEVDQN